MADDWSSPSSDRELGARAIRARKSIAGGPAAVARNVMKANPADADALIFECVELYVPKKLEHLSEIYRATSRQRAFVRSLDELTGVPFPELDRQYLEYMRTLP